MAKSRTAWKPRESGNLAGRPEKENSYKAIIERLTDQDYIDSKTGKNLGNTKELLVKSWIEHALRGGSIGHLRELLDRSEGKVPQPIQELNDEPIDLNELRNVLLEVACVE
jgi:hypothetical protein